MKICSSCDYENSDNGKFCSECGTKLQNSPKFCPECGTKLEGNHKFCPECGFNLLSGEGASCQNDEIEDEEYTETGLVEDFSNSEEDTESEKVYAFETVDFDTIDYNDLSDYTIDELDYIEWHIDSYSDFDYRKSLRILVRNEMGKRYFMGDGVEVDKGKAFELFMKSASSGDPCAQFILGKCYEEGYGMEVKEQTAFKWYKKAAEQGFAEAQEALASCYTYGVGTKIDEDAACEWYELAAVQEDSNEGYVWWKFI